MPQVRHAECDGKPVAYVALGGRAYGSEMMVDDADLDFVLSVSPVWTVGGRLRGTAVGYVMSGCKAARRFARQPGSSEPVAILSRVITGATRSEVVTYANTNTLDIRRQNLLVLSRSEFQKWHASERTARIEMDAFGTVVGNTL